MAFDQRDDSSSEFRQRSPKGYDGKADYFGGHAEGKGEDLSVIHHKLRAKIEAGGAEDKVYEMEKKGPCGAGFGCWGRSFLTSNADKGIEAES